ncbi:unnamed protein product [Fraxinus pennsylvanica]|uniref:Uncharacterized protein n=1 Tax=Fraxinus pennsylvanica TaxID=56036 RepID=A0AAD1ZHB0_9LAMI|nr:unnamed protein product [Fraxinus pennsylvanica]
MELENFFKMTLNLYLGLRRLSLKQKPKRFKTRNVVSFISNSSGILTNCNRQPWQLQKRLQTTIPAASLPQRSGWWPGTISALAQKMLFALESKAQGFSFSFSTRVRLGDEEPEPELISLVCTPNWKFKLENSGYNPSFYWPCKYWEEMVAK